MDIASKFILPGIFFILTLVFGVWLGLAGKPYNGVLFNVHKLIALGAVLLAGWQIFQLLKSGGYSVTLFVLLTAAALCIIALFASGALMSAEKLDHTVMATVHRIALAALLVVAALVVYMFGFKA